MLLLPRTESRYAYRAALGVRDGMTGQLGPDYFDAIYDDTDEAKARYQEYLAAVR